MAKTKQQADAGLPTFQCVSPIEHDGERIEIGDVFAMDAETAAALVAAGAAVPMQEAAPAVEGEGAPQA